MGAYIQSKADNEICQILNKRFGDDQNPNDPGRTYLQGVQYLFAQEDLFNSGHTLNRVFHRLATSVLPAGQRVPHDKKSRLRWLYFLRTGMPKASKDAIKQVLRFVLANPSIAYVTFSTFHTATKTKTFELDPDNAGSPVLSVDGGKIYCQLTLLCHEDKPLPDADNEQDPPHKDNGEKRMRGRRRTKRAGRKSAVKKSSARKRVSKKAATGTASD